MIWLPVIFAAVFVAMVFSALIRGAFDAERWKVDPGYCRYGAPMREVPGWWWKRSRLRRGLGWLSCRLGFHARSYTLVLETPPDGDAPFGAHYAEQEIVGVCSRCGDRQVYLHQLK
jgi:hypothetical protein